MMTVREMLTARVHAALQTLYANQQLAGTCPEKTHLLLPKQADHGDFCCASALQLAKTCRQAPRDIAKKLQDALGLAYGLLEKTEIAGAGYLNLFVNQHIWQQALQRVLTLEEACLRSHIGNQESVLLEFVSANPTGPLHVAHGRGAALGDVLGNLLMLAGFNVTREYYINDMGHQADVMARSIYLRYAEALGRPLTPPEEFYPGDYITDLAQDLLQQEGNRFLDQPETVWLSSLRKLGITCMLARIDADLAAFGVHFDQKISEQAITAAVGLQGMLQILTNSGHVYEQDGKQWFASTTFGDDKDRVLIRQDGRPTYFAADLAYHHDKMQRGFKHLINIWGADHDGYMARLKAGLTALGHDASKLKIIFIQMVSLSSGGQSVRMGKRLGTAVWLREIIDEAGKDATRYLFLTRRAEAQMDFDIDLAKRKSLDNPVYYAQMGHARLASIAQRAADLPHDFQPVWQTGVLDALILPEEYELIKHLDEATHVVQSAAIAFEPHQITEYLQVLISKFHSYYSKYRDTDKVISDNAAKTRARLLLCRGLQIVTKALLQTLGVEAPQRMTMQDGLEQPHA